LKARGAVGGGAERDMRVRMCSPIHDGNVRIKIRIRIKIKIKIKKGIL